MLQRFKEIWKKILLLLEKKESPFFSSRQDIFFTTIIFLSTTLCVFLRFYQRHFFSKRYFLYSLLIGLLVGLIFAWLRRKVILPVFNKTKKSLRIFLIVLSILFSIVILANILILPVYALIPQTDLRIIIPIPESSQPIRMLWIKNGQGFVHFSHLIIEGEWEQDGKHLVFPSGQEVSIQWRGAVGPYTEIAFREPDYRQNIEVEWLEDTPDGFVLTSTNSDLILEEQLDGTRNIVVPLRLKVSFLYYLPYIVSFLILVSFAIIILFLFIASFPNNARKKRVHKYRWLLFALPMILVWTLVLMIFWPGILTNDGLGQWSQAETGNYNDWQSVIYSILIFILTRIWHSPAIIAILQIIALSTLIAYGLHIFEEQGVHPLILWCICIIFTIFPVNTFFQSIIWKDIPYAIAFLWLTIILLRIYFSEGGWINDWKHILTLSLCTSSISLFRKNGLAVSAVLLLLLIFIYSKNWKTYLLSAGLSVLLYLGITGPLYSAVDISDESPGQSNLIFLHHFAAHIDAGTNLTAEESSYLDSFLPLEEWEYWCYYVRSISYHPNFRREAFLSSGRQNASLAWDFFLRNPQVDIDHTLCAGELVWRVKNTNEYIKSTHGFHSWAPGKEGWVIENEFGIEQASVFPTIVQPFMQQLRWFGFADDYLVWFLRPALYLYLSLFCLAIYFFRKGDWHVWIIGVPVFIQSVVLFLISFAPAFRYQYGTCLVGLLLVGLIFLPSEEKTVCRDEKD